ncbi:MAG: DUF4020 domain-containing protein [Candidatus Dadabacteria bacterium]|nr:DUF4020 domain-containing protein [Candidatus Dadabacteria bacterium]
MRLSGIDFPKGLLDALSNDSLVVFAGAGVSRGEPANLPDFRSLAEAIAEGTPEALGDSEPEDQFLGRLSSAGVNVHERAAEKLCENKPEPAELHRDLLRLFSKPESVRIVTTNFDLLFERAAEGIFDPGPNMFRAPALPVGNRFRGIAHIHGSVDRLEDMILTDADFGRAYIVEGWTQRFLVDLFEFFTVLFVGYSHSDIIMNYMARALPAGKNITRFILTDDKEIEKWKMLGISPIVYPSPSAGDHSALYKGIGALAEYVSWDALDWKRKIKKIDEKEPLLLDEEEKDIVSQALSENAKVPFFTDVASSPQWVGWLDENGYLEDLFGNADLNEPDLRLANWLARRFARRHPERIFVLISRRGPRLNPRFWEKLARRIGQDRNSWDKNTLSRWISLLLSTAPKNPHDTILLWLGERCIEHGLLDDLVEVFGVLTAGSMELYARLGLPAEDPNLSITTDWKPASNRNKINLLWENGLKPNLDQVAEPLLASIIRQIENQHRRLAVWGNADRDRNPASSRRSAIESDEQDKHPESFDVLIDAARDCLQWLASKRPETASQLCDRMAGAEAPLLRRLAAHTLFTREDLSPDEKIDWILSRMNLHDLSTHHELFRAVTKTYPAAAPEKRQDVIDTVFAYRWPDEEDESSDLYSAQVHIDWLHALHAEEPDCDLAGRALNDLRKRSPALTPKEHPEHLSRTSEARYSFSQSPWTVEELLSEPGGEWVEKLSSFRQEKLLGPDRPGLVSAVGETARKDPEWGFTFAGALAERKEWISDIWAGLLSAFSETSMKENEVQEVLELLSQAELRRANSLPAARVLLSLTRDEKLFSRRDFLTKANRIAEDMWDCLDDGDEVPAQRSEWPEQAVNHPAGILVQFWLNSFCLQNPRPQTIEGEHAAALLRVCQDETLAGRLGRCILGGRFSLLLKIDEKWAKQNLLPLFGKCIGKDDCYALWSGFLQWQKITPDIAELLESSFLKAVNRFKDCPDSQLREKFIESYTTMLVDFASNPIEKWIPKFFEDADEEWKCHFTFAMKSRLASMDSESKRQLWERWLKLYWKNRLQGVPAPLNPHEISAMLHWLPHFEEEFPEAVDLAVEIKQITFEIGLILSGIEKSGLCQRHPEAAAKLLIYLVPCGLDGPNSSAVQDLAAKLLQSEIPKSLRTELEDLAAQSGPM